MNKHTDKKQRKSLFIYTALIFIVAILVIILAFFGQTHLEDSRQLEAEQTNGLIEKASQLSNENMYLSESNKTLLSENDKLKTVNDELTAENEQLKKEAESSSKLLEAYDAYESGKKKTARTLLGDIYTNDLNEEQKAIYDTLAKKTK